MQDLASAGQTKRPTSCLLILSKGTGDEDEEMTELYKAVEQALKKMDPIV